MGKVALITGITGQDGAYLTEFLIKKGYTVHGIKRRSSMFNTDRIDHLYQDPHVENRNLILHYGDLTDSLNLTRIIGEVQPDEIYNLAAMRHVKVSFDTPEYTANADGLGVLRILEAVRLLNLIPKTRIYQASTSELYGLVQEVPQRETTPFYPRSPYAVAKLYGYWITVNYREAYHMHASNGIWFNHESPLKRIPTPISSKAIRSCQICMAFEEIGVGIRFKGEGIDEVAIIESIDEGLFVKKVGDAYLENFKKRVGEEVVGVDPQYFRPTEVELLIGDATKARTRLGWEPEYSLAALIEDMMKNDIKLMKKESYLKEGGYKILNYFE